MKRFCVAMLLALFSCAASAQKYVPVIKAGTILNYDIFARATAQKTTVNLTIISTGDPVKIKWNIPGLGTGYFEINAKSIQSATQTTIKEPDPDATTKLPDNQSLLSISKDAFSSLVNNRSFKLNGYTFVQATDTANNKINNRDLDVFYAVSTDGNRALWILNNPAYPLIFRSKRAIPGLDFTLTGITE